MPLALLRENCIDSIEPNILPVFDAELFKMIS
jgi:hypothetical protein